MTFTVLVIVTITKFTHGAWLVFVIMPMLFIVMLGINRYYRDVDHEIEVDTTTTFGAQGDHAIVLVGRMQKPMLKALDYAIAARHDIDRGDPRHHRRRGNRARSKRSGSSRTSRCRCASSTSPYRDISMPLIKYIKAHREEHGSEVVTVYTPLYIVGHWWENLLHNHKARRIRHKLMLVHGVIVALVPWLLDSSELIYSRPLASAARPGSAAVSRCAQCCASVAASRSARAARRSPRSAVQDRLACSWLAVLVGGLRRHRRCASRIDTLLPHGDDGFPCRRSSINVRRLVRARRCSSRGSGPRRPRGCAPVSAPGCSARSRPSRLSRCRS